MPLLVDAHCDLAWNMLCFGRDYNLAAAETRRREVGSLAVEVNEDTLIGWPDYQRGHVAIIFATLFAAPNRSKEGKWDKLSYGDFEEAHRLYRQELQVYHELSDSKPDHFRLIQNRKDLDEHLEVWTDPGRESRPVGLVPLMEGADGIRSADELDEWHALGLRLIGLAWAGTRYAGGTKDPGPLTEDGRRLLRAMADLGIVLDLSHMDERAALEALDLYEGPVVATHVNCLTLLPGFPTNRHYSDAVLRKIIERGGIIGNVPVNSFLKTGWAREQGSRREEVPLDAFAAHLDHVCQLAGDSLHSGIGSDFDGGFGLQSVPPEIDTVADLQKVVPLLEKRGYSPADAENILGLNWLRLLRGSLPG
ncbi:MAG: membrane dipeptidase [Chloroflexota bacterium]